MVDVGQSPGKAQKGCAARTTAFNTPFHFFASWSWIFWPLTAAAVRSGSLTLTSAKEVFLCCLCFSLCLLSFLSLHSEMGMGMLSNLVIAAVFGVLLIKFLYPWLRAFVERTTSRKHGDRGTSAMIPRNSVVDVNKVLDTHENTISYFAHKTVCSLKAPNHKIVLNCKHSVCYATSLLMLHTSITAVLEEWAWISRGFRSDVQDWFGKSVFSLGRWRGNGLPWKSQGMLRFEFYILYVLIVLTCGCIWCGCGLV